MGGPEKFPANNLEHREKLVALEKFIESISQEYRENDAISIGNDGRIDPNSPSYRALYRNVDQDVERSRGQRKIGYENLPDEELERVIKETDGEKLEMLAYAVLYKNLNSRFVVARSSHHDDRLNKVDTILLDRETGNLVCAFDEVGDTSGGVDYQKKQDAVRNHNIEKGGATLKYGLKLELQENGKKRITASDVSNVPLFYLALPKDRIEKGINEFTPSKDSQSDYEKKLFEYFMAVLSLQVRELELYSRRLDANLKQRLVDFKKVHVEINRKEK